MPMFEPVGQRGHFCRVNTGLDTEVKLRSFRGAVGVFRAAGWRVKRNGVETLEEGGKVRR